MNIKSIWWKFYRYTINWNHFELSEKTPGGNQTSVWEVDKKFFDRGYKQAKSEFHRAEKDASKAYDKVKNAFELEHDGDDVKIMERIEGDEDLRYAIGEGRERSKWHDHDEDMLALSLEFRETTFILSGEGEDSEDLWKTKYKNGKKAEIRGIIAYPEFGELS